jgi:hypothetical protein
MCSQLLLDRGHLAQRLEGDLTPLGADADQLVVVLIVSARAIAALVLDSPARARPVEELHDVCDHADGLAPLLVVGLPLAPLQPAVHADPTALAGVPRDALRRRAVDVDVEVVGVLVDIALGEAWSVRYVSTCNRT